MKPDFCGVAPILEALLEWRQTLARRHGLRPFSVQMIELREWHYDLVFGITPERVPHNPKLFPEGYL